jgi:hypothetical protein
MGQRAPAVEAIQRTHRREKRLLRNVLCRSGVADHNERRSIRAVPVAPEQLLQSLLRAALRLPHPRALAPVDLVD